MNWGQGIAVFLTVFVSFMGFLVYKTTQSTVHLEAEDYYQQEIAYQERIDANANGKVLDERLSIEREDGQLVIRFDDAGLDLESGVVRFFRPNDADLDREFQLEFVEGEYRIPVTELTRGKYEVDFDWKKGEDLYAVQRLVYLD